MRTCCLKQRIVGVKHSEKYKYKLPCFYFLSPFSEPLYVIYNTIDIQYMLTLLISAMVSSFTMINTNGTKHAKEKASPSVIDQG